MRLNRCSVEMLKPVSSALKGIYRAIDAAAGETALGAFEYGHRGRGYRAFTQSWRRAWTEVVPFCAFPPDHPTSGRGRSGSCKCQERSDVVPVACLQCVDIGAA